MRVDNVAAMAAGGGWASDVLVFPPAEPNGSWPWGSVLTGEARTRRDLRLARLRWEFDRRRWNYDALLQPLHLQLDRVLSGGGYSLVHWRNLDGALAASGIARRHGCAFVLDLHENHPYNMWSTGRDSASSGRLYDLSQWFEYERRAVDAADAVLVTIDEMGQRLIGMHDTDPAKICVVHNAEPPDRWRDVPMDNALAARFNGRLVMLYGGTCSRHRGLDTIIKALPSLAGDLPALDFVIVGYGGPIDDWRRLAAKLEVGDRVHFEGRKTFPELQRYHRIAAFGVVPHHKYGQTDNTVPHKLYQNMISGLPTLVSSCHCLERIIRSSEAGLVFEAGHPASAANAIRRMADAGLRDRLAANARLAIDAPPLSWASSAERLLHVYETLA